MNDDFVNELYENWVDNLLDMPLISNIGSQSRIVTSVNGRVIRTVNGSDSVTDSVIDNILNIRRHVQNGHTEINNNFSYPSGVPNFNNLISNSVIDTFQNLFDVISEAQAAPEYEDVKVTLSEEDFQKLKTTTLKETTDKECNICLDSFKINDTTTTLPCDHVFHKNCIHDWLCNEKVSCPVCRFDVRNSNSNLNV